MNIHGFNAKHFPESAVTLVDEAGDPDLCPDDATRDHYVRLALVDAAVGLALTVTALTPDDSIERVMAGLDSHDAEVAPVLNLPAYTDRKKTAPASPGSTAGADDQNPEGDRS